MLFDSHRVLSSAHLALEVSQSSVLRERRHLVGEDGIAVSSTTQRREDFTEGIKYLDLIREVLFSSSIKPGKMNRLRGKTI